MRTRLVPQLVARRLVSCSASGPRMAIQSHQQMAGATRRPLASQHTTTTTHQHVSHTQAQKHLRRVVPGPTHPTVVQRQRKAVGEFGGPRCALVPRPSTSAHARSLKARRKVGIRTWAAVSAAESRQAQLPIDCPTVLCWASFTIGVNLHPPLPRHNLPISSRDHNPHSRLERVQSSV